MKENQIRRPLKNILNDRLNDYHWQVVSTIFMKNIDCVHDPQLTLKRHTKQLVTVQFPSVVCDDIQWSIVQT